MRPYSRHLYQWVNSRFEIKRGSSKWIMMACPYCGNKIGRGGAVHFGFQIFKCWACERKEGLMDMMMYIEGVDYPTAKTILQTYNGRVDIDLFDIQEMKSIVRNDNAIPLPEGFISISEGDGIIGQRARKYLTDRGFDIEILDRKGVGYIDSIKEKNYFGRIILPYRRNNRLVYWSARTIIDEEPKYKNPEAIDGVGKSELIYNEDLLWLENELYLNEGIFDSETLQTAIAIGGVHLSDTQKDIIIKSPVQNVVICLDGGYYKQGLMIAMELVEFKKVKVLDLPDKKDANELGKTEIEKIKDETPYINFNEIFEKYYG